MRNDMFLATAVIGLTTAIAIVLGRFLVESPIWVNVVAGFTAGAAIAVVAYHTTRRHQ